MTQYIQQSVREVLKSSDDQALCVLWYMLEKMSKERRDHCLSEVEFGDLTKRIIDYAPEFAHKAAFIRVSGTQDLATVATQKLDEPWDALANFAKLAME